MVSRLIVILMRIIIVLLIAIAISTFIPKKDKGDKKVYINED